MTTFTSIDGTVTTTINDEGLEMPGAWRTVERCITGPPYQVPTGGFASADGRSQTYYETCRDQVRIENRGDHYLLFMGSLAARLDQASALELMDALREITDVGLDP